MKPRGTDGERSTGAAPTSEGAPWDPHRLLEQVLAERNLSVALRRVEQNKGAAGVDGMRTQELRAHLRANWAGIRETLLLGTHRPMPVRRVEIPKPGGGKRLLGIPTVVDRLIQQALLQVLTPIFDPTFSDHSYGFRPGRKAQDAVQAAKAHIEAGYDWVVDLDLGRFSVDVSAQRKA